MIGQTLALYFAGRFAKMVLAMFVLFFFLIATISYFELVGKLLRDEDYNALIGTAVVLLKVPSVSEHALPFAALFGSIAAFVIANRRLEVVVSRAAGISAWQFLLPATVVGLVLGVVATTLYNPLAVKARELASSLNAEFLSDTPTAFRTNNGPVWLRQAGGDRESVIGASESFDGGLGLTGVTAMVFDREGQFIERIDAGTARYTSGEWVLSNGTVTAPGRTPERVENYRIITTLGPDHIKQTFDNIDGISFWGLPNLIATAEGAGISSDRYRLRYNALLAQPVLLVAMVLVAAIVSLRFSRSKELGQMILAGIGVGFVLYIVTKIARDLGNAGIVAAPVAAWLPAIVATLIGITVLLHLEDG